jgi:hypothetical protein
MTLANGRAVGLTERELEEAEALCAAADFIAAARDLVPRLLAEVRRLQAALDALAKG